MDDFMNAPDSCEFCRYRIFSQIDSTFVCVNHTSQLFGEDVFPGDWCEKYKQRKDKNGKKTESHDAAD